MLRIVYIVLGVAAIGLLAVEAPHGALLTTRPERGKVEVTKDASGKTVRSGPVFIWLGGGYQGGK